MVRARILFVTLLGLVACDQTTDAPPDALVDTPDTSLDASTHHAHDELASTDSSLHGHWACNTRLPNGKHSQDRLYFGRNSDFSLTTDGTTFSGSYTLSGSGLELAIHISAISNVGSTSRLIESSVDKLNDTELTLTMNYGRSKRLSVCTRPV